jgi:plastocyanin
MKRRGSSLIIGILFALVVVVPASGTDWQAKLGAQSQDKGRQVLAFLPNEFWIHVNDTITWTSAVDELHTVTLPAGAVRLPFFVGCPGFSTSPATFSGSCISAQAFTSPNSFTVLFAETGNFKLTCLLHEDMTGVVHVLEASTPLPHDQAFYDTQGAQQARELLAAQGMTMGDMQTENHEADVPNTVIAGTGRIFATGGGHQTVSILRFVQPEIMVHVGDTVEWTNPDAITPHTVTFGPDPPTPIRNIPSANVTTDPDGARHATISTPSPTVHSGFIQSAHQERVGLPATAPGTTRFRVTFTIPGVFPYDCALHDDLGMVGQIVVLP